MFFLCDGLIHILLHLSQMIIQIHKKQQWKKN